MKQLAVPFLAASLLSFQAPAPKAVQRDTAALKKLTLDVALLESRLRVAENRIMNLENLNSEEVTLDASHPGAYAEVATTSGRFLLSLVDAQPYLDGYKVTLDVGNTSAASYVGFNLYALWIGSVPALPDPLPSETDAAFGKRLDAWSKANDAWTKASEAKHTQSSFTETLQPASWTRVQMTLSPATADDVKEIKVRMVTNLVSLKR